MRPQSATPSPALSAPTGEEADPRDRRGRRHRLGCIILICLCAVLCGARSLTAGSASGRITHPNTPWPAWEPASPAPNSECAPPPLRPRSAGC
ncbi:transposase family protein [Nocardiopsis metallicus]|uniref:transposase family protein n=1 Tax=Nocardiopsis metallicus TaxID=179819 RepID=UPI001FEA618B|nr:transposase family protein [Nocardiopsis metallicus]